MTARGEQNPILTIQRKRDGHELTREEIEWMIAAYVAGKLADYQMSALLMAMFLKGMSDAETVALMEAMLHSGKILTLSRISGPKIDKHSTGGVGDKVSICLAPLVAACGVYVPMISGRGLGHTGGTLDKLAAIPGFRTDLDAETFERVVRETGASLIGQTAEIAPADKLLYALRDVTGTVDSIPLIVASILSKKLAEGIDGLVLDVKVGKGAFMQDMKSARKLGKTLVRVGTRAGKRVSALVTDMSSPLGRCVGNALETREALDLLAGQAPPDLLECTLALGEEMLVLGRVAKNRAAARKRLTAALVDGSAARTMERIVRAHGGDADVVKNRALLPRAALEEQVVAPTSGYVGSIDAREIGLAAVALGAGRRRTDHPIDLTVGIELLAKPGDSVKKGTPLARLHVRAPAPDVADQVLAAFRITPRRPRATPIVLERIGH
jgi:pyrimidine-nucleoside phosphorylase